MTETDWIGCVDPEPMIEVMVQNGGRQQRKLLLFAVASFVRLKHLLPHRQQHQGIAILEQMSDGTCIADERRNARRHVLVNWRGSSPTGDHSIDDPDQVALMLYRAIISSDAAGHAAYATRGILDSASKRCEQCALLRDIFSNPYHLVTFDTRWRTSDVLGLARAIYDDRAFDRMPILADALMEAGCTDEQVLSHCRGDGPHVRGCWVVDMVLGKE